LHFFYCPQIHTNESDERRGRLGEWEGG
jgi:hypothetical protein